MGVDIAYLRIKRVIGDGEECFLCSLEDEIESKYMEDRKSTRLNSSHLA